MHSESFFASLAIAQEHAQFGKNDVFLAEMQNLANASTQNAPALISLGRMLLRFGFLSQARQCLSRATLIAPDDRDGLLALAQCELQLGSENRFQGIAADLLQRFPCDLNLISQLLNLSQYLPHASRSVFSGLAERWGKLAVHAAGGEKVRPRLRALMNRPLRIGYVSADFCQHTVGILIKEVLARHDPKRATVFCYNAGSITDWVTEFIGSHAALRGISSLSDGALAKQIEDDQIDVLIDLSGHTGGSRLAAFAYRPAPVMVSMLGYYATTGLQYMDAALLDEWHVHDNTQQDFIEPITLMPTTRWCFYPAFPAPRPAPPPCTHKGFITFGSFNNTLKYNPEVYALWARLLIEIPSSRLILKWRTFNDPMFRQMVLEQFIGHGIEASRIELRGPSFHMQMLEEYKDMDIALDPFPFSGGATSCEALYMGVPVITWPQEQVVSKQTSAFVSMIGHTDWVAKDPDDFIVIAKDMASSDLLVSHRQGLRTAMLHSPLMNVDAYCTHLETFLGELYQRIYTEQHG